MIQETNGDRNPDGNNDPGTRKKEEPGRISVPALPERPANPDRKCPQKYWTRGDRVRS